MSDYAFSLTDVKFVRQGSQILHVNDWRVRFGENWVLLGANGIGKSTLVQILSTRLFPTSGSVQVLGEQLGKTDVFKLRPKIGVLGADYANTFNLDERVIDIVAFGASTMTGGWGDARDNAILTEENRTLAEQKLQMFAIEKLKSKQWRVLSQGERKRVQMARVMMGNPELLLFDEPTAGLDLAGREIVINMLNKIAAKRATHSPAIVLVNHHVEEIPPAFDKVALMGRVQDCAQSCEQVSIRTAPGTILYQGSISDVLTSRNLTQAYGIDLTVQKLANLRYHASTSVIIDA